MPKALYLKYRPQTFDQVQGQEHVTRTLKNALALGRIAHAYLFTGPRGTGKTSTARILAKAVNCTSESKPHPCNECAICRAINEERLLDLYEIDAASNTGVDNIRDLRDKVDFRPSEARYKVYIIDEAHMLSTAAFNALLKTLEEPPSYVIFVLATTEPSRIPATITSRCQRFDFRRATLVELTGQLAEIARQERLEIEPAALELIARQATGSFRDATSLLDQLISFGSGTVTLAQVQGLLGAASFATVQQIAASIADRDIARGMNAIAGAVDAGADPRQLAREIVDYLRGVLLLQNGSGAALTASAETREEMKALAQQIAPEQLLRAIRLFNQAVFELRGSSNPTLPLEMALVETTLEPGTPYVPAPPAPRREQPRRAQPAPAEHAANAEQEAPAESKPTASAAAPAVEENQQQTIPAASDEIGKKAKEQTPAEALTVQAVQEQWSAVLARFHKLNKSTEALLKDAQPVALEGNTVVIGFAYDLHRNRIENDKRGKAQIEQVISELLGKPLHVRCVLSPKKQKLKAAQDDPLVREAMNLGGKITDVS